MSNETNPLPRSRRPPSRFADYAMSSTCDSFTRLGNDPVADSTQSLESEPEDEITHTQDKPDVINLPSYDPGTRPSQNWGILKCDEIWEELNSAYKVITKWRPNLFLLPTGHAGRSFIDEITRLALGFAHKTDMETYSITAILIICPLLLQKPSKNSKTTEHVTHLERRLELWKAGKIATLLKEGKTIQARLASSKKHQEHSHRIFSRLMLQGKVSAALKWINDNDNTGICEINENVLEQLKNKHPPAQSAQTEFALNGPKREVCNVLFDSIDEKAIYESAKHTRGSGGPSGINADGMKRILCSTAFKRSSKDLCYAMALVARRMCTAQIDPKSLSAFNSCRLIPLKKKPEGVRPIGIGEVLKRIIGKAVIRLIKNDIVDGVGSLQVCAGQEGGSEAAIHAMRNIFEHPETEAVLLVDATNAFNCLNRKMALTNIEKVCPEMATYLLNTYREPAHLHVRDNAESLRSEEGTTQGDPAAMGFYACSTTPIISTLKNEPSVKQVWFADDATAAGKLDGIKTWWSELIKIGPHYGYFPNPTKTILIVKPQHLIKAKTLLSDTGITITDSGNRHLGAAIGSSQFKEEYILKLVADWVKDVEELAKIAKSDPHSAYSCFVFGLANKWKYFQRTIPNTSQLYEPLESAIAHAFIPAIIGRACSSDERHLLSLPCRLGGLGIANPVETANTFYEDSEAITKPLTDLIVQQQEKIPDTLKNETTNIKKSRTENNNNLLKQKTIEIYEGLTTTGKRCMDLNSEKAASIWLTSLPLSQHAFYLNKQEFHDALSLRYGWEIKNVSKMCVCGEKNTINHALICKRGGFVIMRHNEIRDLEAEMISEICKDVTIEPHLLPCDDTILPSTTNTAIDARLDFSARSFWSPLERAFFDVRVVHPNSASYRNTKSEQIYKQHENQKKTAYNTRVLEVEHGTFTPLIYSTTGGMGKECQRYHKHLAIQISHKRKEEYSTTIAYINRRLRFAILRTTLIAIRGTRISNKRYFLSQTKMPIAEVDMNLV